MESPTAPTPPDRLAGGVQGRTGALLPLILGLPISAGLIGAAWRTSGMRWALDWDVLTVVALTLVPLGPACLAVPLALARRLAATATGPSLPLAVLAWLSLAWAEVWLDGGRYTGATGKLLGGTSALLGTPLAAAVAVVVVAAAPAARREIRLLWPWALLAAVQLAGWGWFLRIMLTLRF